MSSHAYQQLQSGLWAEPNPRTCPCRGGGWLCSNLDTWHRCPIHGAGVPHPDDEVEFDGRAHMTAVLRQAFVTFRNAAVAAGFRGDFKAACRAEADGEPATPQEWVDAAEAVFGRVEDDAAEEAAHRMGFSCALEARWAAEAARENLERQGLA